jgi:hypothetical protein
LPAQISEGVGAQQADKRDQQENPHMTSSCCKLAAPTERADQWKLASGYRCGSGFVFGAMPHT